MEKKLNTSLDLPSSSSKKSDDQFFTFTFLNPQNVYLSTKKRRQYPVALGQMMSPQSATKLALAQNQNKKQESSFLELYPGLLDLHLKQTRFQVQVQEKEFFGFIEKSIVEAKQKERAKLQGTRQTLQQQQLKQPFMKFQQVSSFEEHQAFDFIQDQQLYRRSGDKGNSQARKLKFTYRMVKSDSKLVRQTLEANGFRVAQQSAFCSLVWTGKPDCQQSGEGTAQLAVSKEGHYFEGLKSLCGKLNHFPLSSELARKDRLTLNIQSMIQKHGKEAYGSVIPESYVLPLQLKEFREAFHEPTKQHNNYWISKPVDACQGKGIFISNKLQDFAEGVENQQVTPQVISRYITDPLLIYRRKFDLRIYALVTDFEPFPKFYVYKEGLVRFATKEFDMKNLKNRKQHLTNYSINKVKLKEPEKSSPKNAFDLFTEQTYNEHHTQFDPFKSPKWKMSALMAYLETLKVDTYYLMAQIHSAMLKTLLASESRIHQFLKAKTQKAGFFELYGFDVLLDENLKPWILEVNMMPSLACDSELDFSIKAPLVADALNIVGVKPANDTHLGSILHKEQMKSSGQTSSYFNQASSKNKRFQTVYEQENSAFQTARSKSFSPQKKQDSRNQTSLQAVKFFLNCKQQKRENLLDFCAEYSRSEQTNFQLVFPSPTLGSYLQKDKVETNDQGYLLQGIQVHNLFTPYLQEGAFFGHLLSLFHSDQNKADLDQQVLVESPSREEVELEERKEIESELQEKKYESQSEPKATEKRIQEMRRKYQKSPAKSTRKEDQKELEEKKEVNDQGFFQIQEVEEIAEQIQDDPILEARRPAKELQEVQSIQIQHFNTVDVKPQEERLVQEGILPSQQQSQEKFEPSKIQTGSSNLRTLVPANLVTLAQSKHKEVILRQAFEYDSGIKGDDYMAEFLRRLIQILKLVPYIRIDLSAKKNILDFLEHKNWGKSLPQRQKDQNPILNKQVLVKCLEQRVQDLRAKSLRKFKKAFIRHHRNHLEEGQEETLLERLSFQEVERRVLQEFSHIEGLKSTQFDNVENSRIEQEIIEKIDQNNALQLLIPESQQQNPLSTYLSQLIDLANKPYSQQRKMMPKLEKKKNSLRQHLQPDQSCIQVNTTSPFQNEILKSVSKHASSQASFDHSIKSKKEDLTQSELTLKRREAKRDEILLNFVNPDHKRSKKLDMQQIQRDIIRNKSQKRDRSHEDLQKIQSIQNLNHSLDPYQQRQSIQMRQTTFRVQDLSKAIQVRNIIMKSSEQQNQLSVNKESRNQEQIQQKSFQQTAAQISPQSKKNQSFRQKRKTNYSTVQRDSSLQSTFLSPVNKSVIAQVSIKFYKQQQQLQQQRKATNRSLIVTNFKNKKENSLCLPQIQAKPQ